MLHISENIAMTDSADSSVISYIHHTVLITESTFLPPTDPFPQDLNTRPTANRRFVWGFFRIQTKRKHAFFSSKFSSDVQS